MHVTCQHTHPMKPLHQDVDIIYFYHPTQVMGMSPSPHQQTQSMEGQDSSRDNIQFYQFCLPPPLLTSQHSPREVATSLCVITYLTQVKGSVLNGLSRRKCTRHRFHIVPNKIFLLFFHSQRFTDA